MRLATLRHHGTTIAVRDDGEQLVVIPGVADVGQLLHHPDWQDLARSASGEAVSRAEVAPRQWAPPVPRPSKIICVGLNYREHIVEMGREIPSHPTLFAKFTEALIGPYDPIEAPVWADSAVDWEGELAIVVGRPVRRATPEQAAAAIAGFTVLNDVTMRDRQYRTTQWLQGKTFEHTCPTGPVLLTSDEFTPGAQLWTEVDGEVVQRSATDDLVFDPAALVAYASEIVTLNPGDLIATGTPDGVGHASSPPRHLRAGSRLRTHIDGIGTLDNRVVSVS